LGFRFRVYGDTLLPTSAFKFNLRRCIKELDGKINNQDARDASEKMRVYLEKKAQKKEDFLARKFGQGSRAGPLRSLLFHLQLTLEP
jgi:hypothetical protein